MTRFVTTLSRLALGGVVMLAAAGGAFASDDTIVEADVVQKAETRDRAAPTADPAERAAHYRGLAASYRVQGGVAYKTGLVRHADERAAYYQRLAEPAADAAALEPARLRKLRQMGGIAYRTGLVTEAELEAREAGDPVSGHYVPLVKDVRGRVAGKPIEAALLR